MPVPRPQLFCLAPSPVIYQIPLYRAITSAGRVDLTVFYLSDEGVRPYSAGFGGAPIVWDEDLLEGYQSKWMPGAASSHVSGGFLGLSTRGVVSLVLQARRTRAAVWVHGWSYAANVLVILLCKLLAVPLLLREEQTLLHPRPAPKRWARSLALRALTTGAHCLYIGSNNRDFFAAQGVSQDHLHFVPYTVDQAAIQRQSEAETRAAALLRETYGVPSDAVLVLTVGKLETKKAPLMVLAAVQRLHAEGFECHLLLVGSGPLSAELRARAAGDQRIHLAGFINQSALGGYYRAADLLVLASQYHETWGMVVNEALARELPVLASNVVGSARDLLTREFVFRHDDLDDLVNVLRRLVRAGRDQTMGQRLKRRTRAWLPSTAADGVAAATLAAIGQKHRTIRSATPDEVLDAQ